MTKLNLGFAGTPEFAIPCLEAIARSSHHLQVIYTQPDRPAGRGQKIQASAVKSWAQQHAIPVQQPINFKSAATRDQLRAWQLDVLVVIAYGLILPTAVLLAPRYGCINVHASLLPRWRGASPIQHALLHGDATTGITIMQMDKGMDTGAILTQTEYAITAHETAASLSNALAQQAPAALMTILNEIPECLHHALAQAEDAATYAPKINKSDAAINWHAPAPQIDQQIRAFNPWPISYTQSKRGALRIYQAQISAYPSQQAPGTIITIDRQGIRVATGSHDIYLQTIQFAGGNLLQVSEWSRTGQQQLTIGMQLA